MCEGAAEGDERPLLPPLLGRLIRPDTAREAACRQVREEGGEQGTAGFRRCDLEHSMIPDSVAIDS